MRYLMLFSLAACVHGPLPSALDAVASGLVREPVERLQFQGHEIFYPGSLKREARRLAQALRRCRPPVSFAGKGARFRLILIHPGFENAYMESGPTWPDTIVIPANLLRSGGRLAARAPSALGVVVCHESIHGQQFAQRRGPWGALESLTGFKVNTQAATESWFIEGLATAFEAGIEGPGSRLEAPYWSSAYAAQMALGSGPSSAALSPYYPGMLEFGGDYLSGGNFINWLAETSGRDALAGFVDEQARALVPMVGTGLRFRQQFGASAETLFGRFVNDWRKKHPPRSRPAKQKVLSPSVGLWARLTRSPRSGLLALYSKSLDEPARLRLLDGEGRVIRSRSVASLAGWGQPRLEHPGDLDGFEFGRDGALYLTVLQKNLSGIAENILYRLDGSSLATTGRWSLGRGAAGGVHPTGSTYVYVRYEGGAAWLSRLDLRSGTRSDLWASQGSAPPMSPSYSPDGERIVWVRARGDGKQELWIYEEQEGQPRPLSRGFALLHRPRFISQQKVLMVCSVDQRPQACIHRLDQGETLVVSDAPYGLIDPQHRRSRGLFVLNRTAGGWSLDRIKKRSVRRRFAARHDGDHVAFAPASELLGGNPEPVRFGKGLLKPRFWLPVASGDVLTPADWRVGLWLGGSSDLLLRSYYLLGTVKANGTEPQLDFFYRGRRWAPWLGGVGFGWDPEGTQINWGLERAFGPFWAVQAKATGLHLESDGYFLAGPRLRLQFRAQERTGRGVVYRGITCQTQGAWFPGIGATQPLLDGRVEMAGTLPSPLSARQNLRLIARWRRLAGAPASALRVGGADAPGLVSLALPERAWNLYRFREAMDGYEDQSLAVRTFAVAGVDVRHRIPLHLNRLYAGMLLPSLYFRHLELAAFGRYGQLDSQPHRSVGLEASMAMASGGTSPWTLFARGSWRFDLEDPTHIQFGIRY